MDRTQPTDIKTAAEIGTLAGKLSPKEQAYVYNTINVLLFSQQTAEAAKQIKNHGVST